MEEQNQELINFSLFDNYESLDEIIKEVNETCIYPLMCKNGNNNSCLYVICAHNEKLISNWSIYKEIHATKKYKIYKNTMHKPMFTQTKTLNLRNMNIKDITGIYINDDYDEIDLSHNLIESLTDFNFPDNKNLKKINLSHNKINLIHTSINFKNATHIDLSHNKITSIKEFRNISQIEHLNISNNELYSFEWLEDATNLKFLDVRNNLRVENMPHFAQIVANETSKKIN